MNDNYIFEYSIPKYTISNIVMKIKDKLYNVDIKDYCIKNGVEYELLSDILTEPNFMSYSMYKVASEILNISIDDLTDINESKKTLNFRKLKKCSIEDISPDLDFAKLLFSEIVINARLNSR